MRLQLPGQRCRYAPDGLAGKRKLDTCAMLLYIYEKPSAYLDYAASKDSLQALALSLRGYEPVALSHQQQDSLPHVLQLWCELPAQTVQSQNIACSRSSAALLNHICYTMHVYMLIYSSVCDREIWAQRPVSLVVQPDHSCRQSFSLKENKRQHRHCSVPVTLLQEL